MSEVEIVKDLLKKPILSLVDSLIKEVRQVAFNRILEYQLSEYRSCLITKTMLHRIQPVNLLNIYVPITLDESNQFLDGINLISSKNKKYEIQNAENVIYLLKKYQFLYLYGVAGSGKSTLVKFFIIASIRTGYKIPVRI